MANFKLYEEIKYRKINCFNYNADNIIQRMPMLKKVIIIYGIVGLSFICTVLEFNGVNIPNYINADNEKLSQECWGGGINS